MKNGKISAPHGNSLGAVYIRLYHGFPRPTVYPRVTGSLGVGWRGDQSV